MIVSSILNLRYFFSLTILFLYLAIHLTNSKMSFLDKSKTDEKLESLFNQYLPILESAVKANRERAFFAQYPESPSPKIYGETANNDGLATFQGQLNQAFSRLKQSSDTTIVSSEASPYTREKLNITYPAFSDSKSYVSASQSAFQTWKNTSPQARIAILIHALEKIKSSFFEIAYSTMHSTGQAFMMSFQASGPHANDRALEVLGIAYEELTRFPDQVVWDKPMGKSNVVLNKFFKYVPKGVGLAVGCSTFPIWNSIPGIYASLVTGNSVIVKPHPHGVYPLAIVVAHIQDALVEFGFSADTCILAVDNDTKLITKELAENKDVKIIDFTGGNIFGDYLETLPNKTTFTEKAGVNSAIIDSTTNLKEMAANLAFSVSLYSGQMCTAPQNFFINKNGILNGEEVISYEAVVAEIVNNIKGLVTNEKMGPAILGAIQSEVTHVRVQDAKTLGVKVLLDSIEIKNPEFPSARIASPIVLEVAANQKDIFEKEMFGPIVFIIPTDSTEHSIELAKEMAQTRGAISCAAYASNPEMMNKIAENMAEAATPVSFNLFGPIYVNQNASFSDFHVTGGNPAGNASFTDVSFVSNRFNLVGFRMPIA